MTVFKQANIIAFTVLLLIVSSGCDENTVVSPFSGRDAYFSLYGFISSADTQFVRVVPIRNDPNRDSEPVELDVTVTSLALGSGRVNSWFQVLPRLENGQEGLMFADSTFGHVFASNFRPVVGETYEIEVRRPDGAVSRARARVPHVNKPVVGAYRIQGDSVFQIVHWPGVTEAPAEILSVYRLDSDIFKPEIQIPAAPVFHTNEGRATDQGWEIEINLNNDVADVRAYIVDNLPVYSNLPTLEDEANFPLGLVDVRMRVTVRDSAWTFVSPDANISRIAQPGAISNVENGFGFFGALGTEVDTWLLEDPETLRIAGFNL